MTSFMRPLAFVLAFVFLAVSVLPYGSVAPASPALASPLPNRSFFGMNLYITGQERPKEERYALLKEAQDAGVKWSREELSWANLEPDKKGTYNWSGMDFWINELVGRGINVIGAVQTTPYWASGVPRSTPDWYWHVPANVQDFVDFTYEVALHYKGKIDVWEIWNEPDVDITFRCDGCDRPAIYAQMLAGSYAAIKRANPNAIVLIGGLSI
ncbi:MAG TPA: beta-galactosidase, partial [Chloroflexia bacterium]|nr:beta-galactosidase [Chloroflexia bacterium]